MKYSWNQPICERCWIFRKGLTIPVVVNMIIREEAPFERCSYCGEPTFIGAWIRDDPILVPYPYIELKDDEEEE